MTEPEVAPPVANASPVQDAAFVDDQERVDDPPDIIAAGFAERVAVGADARTSTVAL